MHRDGKENGGDRRWGIRESLFNGYEVSVLRDEKGSGCWCQLYINVNVLNATELYI